MPELADILRLHGPDYLAKYHDRLLPSHRRAIQDICACRTEVMGGHLYRCPQCGQEHYRYHSCKNRHCPKCQNGSADRWIEQQQQLLLSVPYFLATFTLPEGLRPLCRSRQKVLYELIFQASRQALQKLARDPKYVGGTIGMVGVLQTWTRDLRYHPHVHYLIPGGGLAPDGTWLMARYNYLLPEKPLARIFRAKFRDLLKKAGLFDQVPRELWQKDWVVDIISAGSGEAAIKYLAPYIFRVAISNRNILALNEGSVAFRYRQAETGIWQVVTLPAEQFIGRFLQHVLPRGFQKVRAYGLMHPSQRALLASIKERLHHDRQEAPQSVAPAAPSVAARPDAFLCPSCACEMIPICKIVHKRGPP